MTEEQLIESLGVAFLADCQTYIDSFDEQRPTAKPALAFCLYYDSENGGAHPAILPRSVFNSGTDVTDVAAWYFENKWLPAEHPDSTLTLLADYEQLMNQEGVKSSIVRKRQKGFTTMLWSVLTSLSFDNLSRDKDFMYFMASMDEDESFFKKTVPASLLKTYFG